jgi:hypothetical protein
MTGRYVLVGVADNDNDRSEDPGIGNAAIAYINDNGSAKLNIPARPFMVVGVQQSLPKATAALKSYAKQALTKRDPSKIEQGMAAAGMIARDAVKKRITSQEGFAPLSFYTLQSRLKGGWFAGLKEARSSGSFGGAKRKGGFSGTKALIVTGSLLNSITYVVKKRKG